jgi:hypothetical protein
VYQNVALHFRIGNLPAFNQSIALCTVVVSVVLLIVNSFTFHSHPAIVSQSYPVAVLVKTCPVVPTFSGLKLPLHHPLSSAHLYHVLVLFNVCHKDPSFSGSNGKVFSITLLLVILIQSPSV